MAIIRFGNRWVRHSRGREPVERERLKRVVNGAIAYCLSTTGLTASIPGALDVSREERISKTSSSEQTNASMQEDGV